MAAYIISFYSFIVEMTLEIQATNQFYVVAFCSFLYLDLVAYSVLYIAWINKSYSHLNKKNRKRKREEKSSSNVSREPASTFKCVHSL